MRTLQAFGIAARRLGFTRAAERLGIAQPAVARYVSELNILQTALFDRQNNKLKLTPEGRQLADAISGELGQIQAAISSIERMSEKKLVIASSFAFAHLWLMPRLSRLRKVLGDLQPQVLIADDYRDHQRAGIEFSLQFCLAESAGDHAVLLFPEIVYPVAAPEFVERQGVAETGWSEDWLIELREILARDRSIGMTGFNVQTSGAPLGERVNTTTIISIFWMRFWSGRALVWASVN